MRKIRVVTKACSIEVLGFKNAATTLKVKHKIRTIEELCQCGYAGIQAKVPYEAELINRYVKALADGSNYVLLLECEILPFWQPFVDQNGNLLYQKMKRVFGYGSPEMLRVASTCKPDAQIITLEMAIREPFFLRLVWSHLLREAGKLWQEDKLLTIPECVQSCAEIAEEPVVMAAIYEMEANGYVTLDDQQLKISLPTLKDFVEAEDATNKTKGWKGVKLLLQGKSRSEIAEEWGMSRQNISALIQRELTRRPLLKEDRYRRFYETYRLTKEFFCDEKKEPLQTWNYLKAAYKGGKQNYRIEITGKPCFILPNGKKCHTIFAIQKYLLNKWKPERTTLREFTDQYNQFVKAGKAEKTSKQMLLINGTNRTTWFRKSWWTLWSSGNTFRFYDIQARDFSGFYAQIVSYMESNAVSIGSTESIFNAKRDLMQEYDIRDHYELHNLIRKTKNAYREIDGVDRIEVRKMPGITYRAAETGASKAEIAGK